MSEIGGADGRAGAGGLMCVSSFLSRRTPPYTLLAPLLHPYAHPAPSFLCLHSISSLVPSRASILSDGLAWRFVGLTGYYHRSLRGGVPSRSTSQLALRVLPAPRWPTALHGRPPRCKRMTPCKPTLAWDLKDAGRDPGEASTHFQTKPI